MRTAIEGGARPDCRDEELRTPLLLAVHGDHVEAARLLVAAGADPDAQDRREESPGWRPGSPAVSRCCASCCRMGPDLRLRNRFGGIALIPASERGHAAYVRELLRVTDIDVDHVNRLGWTALLEAVILGDGGRAHQEVIELLLAAGARVDLPDGDGTTALEHAERRGFDRIAALLRDSR